MSKLNDAHALAASVAALGRGWFTVKAPASEPPQPLELYEFEACPYCRKVRNVLSELDLPFVSRTCARGSNTRERVVQRGGKTQFPYLVDPNTGREMYESEDIIAYVYETYAERKRPLTDRALTPLHMLGSSVASAIRPRGRRVRPGAGDREQPPRLLELYNFEASPYCRKVREALHELNLDFLVHNVAKKSRRRPQLVSHGGRMMVPYLIDPNTDTAMYESDDIVAYLHATYG